MSEPTGAAVQMTLVLYLPMLGQDPSAFPQLERIYIRDPAHPEYDDHIHVYTRSGGWRRPFFEEEHEAIRAMPGFVADFDDADDPEFASWVFKIPERWRSDFDAIRRRERFAISAQYVELMKAAAPQYASDIAELFGPDALSETPVTPVEEAAVDEAAPVPTVTLHIPTVTLHIPRAIAEHLVAVSELEPELVEDAVGPRNVNFEELAIIATQCVAALRDKSLPISLRAKYTRFALAIKKAKDELEDKRLERFDIPEHIARHMTQVLGFNPTQPVNGRLPVLTMPQLLKVLDAVQADKRLDDRTRIGYVTIVSGLLRNMKKS